MLDGGAGAMTEPQWDNGNRMQCFLLWRKNIYQKSNNQFLSNYKRWLFLSKHIDAVFRPPVAADYILSCCLKVEINYSSDWLQSSDIKCKVEPESHVNVFSSLLLKSSFESKKKIRETFPRVKSRISKWWLPWLSYCSQPRMMENNINKIEILYWSATYPVKLFDVDIFQSFSVFSFLELSKVRF